MLMCASDPGTGRRIQRTPPAASAAPAPRRRRAGRGDQFTERQCRGVQAAAQRVAPRDAPGVQDPAIGAADDLGQHFGRQVHAHVAGTPAGGKDAHEGTVRTRRADRRVRRRAEGGLGGADQDARQLRGFLDLGGRPRKERRDALRGGGGRLELGIHDVQEARLHLAHQRPEQHLLGGKVVERGGARDLRKPGDVVDRRAGDALACEQGACGRQQCRAHARLAVRTPRRRADAQRGKRRRLGAHG
jgi:hypothetical protein